MLTGEDPGPDYYMKMDVPSHGFAYVCVRASGGSEGAFAAYCAIGGAGTVYLQEFAVGMASTLNMWGSSIADGDEIYLEASGSNLTVKVNGVALSGQPISDPTLSDGTAALVFYGTLGRGDNIEVDNLGGGGGGPTCRGALSLLGVGGC
jgi:hypothetical protein